MTFPDEQAPTGLQQRADDLGPASNTRQPTESADARKDHVEAIPPQQLGRLVDISLDVLDVRSGVPRKAPGYIEGRR
jgi:hypothetical protein